MVPEQYLSGTIWQIHLKVKTFFLVRLPERRCHLSLSQTRLEERRNSRGNQSLLIYLSGFIIFPLFSVNLLIPIVMDVTKPGESSKQSDHGSGIRKRQGLKDKPRSANNFF